MGTAVRRGRRSSGVTGVVLVALAGDGSVLRELPVELHDQTALSVRVPEGTRTLRLTGTRTPVPRFQVERGPERHVIVRRLRRGWSRRR